MKWATDFFPFLYFCWDCLSRRFNIGAIVTRLPDCIESLRSAEGP